MTDSLARFDFHDCVAIVAGGTGGTGGVFDLSGGRATD